MLKRKVTVENNSFRNKTVFKVLIHDVNISLDMLDQCIPVLTEGSGVVRVSDAFGS